MSHLRFSIIVSLFLLATLSATALVSDSSEAADPPENTWIATTASNASLEASWENGTLLSGQKAWFISSYNGNCAWDVTTDVSGLFISGYTGILTQGAAVNITIGSDGYYQRSGTATFSTQYVICNGPFFYVSGTLTSNKLNLIMTGDGQTITSPGVVIPSLKISGNTTYTYTGPRPSITTLTVDEDKTISVASGKLLAISNAAFGDLYNNGTIAGSGQFTIELRNSDETIFFGNIECDTILNAYSTSSANRVLTAGSDTVFAKTLTVKSSHATYTMTLDMADHDLTVNGSIYILARGNILAGEGIISNGGVFDTSAGSFNPETCDYVSTGVAKTIKMAAGQTLYNWTVAAGSSVTLLSNINVTNWMELDSTSVTKGAYTLTAPLMTISSSITATGTEDAAYSYAPTADQPISSVSVVTNGTWLSIVGTSVVGTPTNAEVGSYYVNVTCTNVIGSVSQNSTITISNAAPVWLTTDYSTEWSYGMTYSYDPTASDEGAGLTYSMTTSAIELRCDPASGAIRGKVLDNSITVSLMADDGNGAVIWQNWTITAMGFSWDGDILVNYTEGQNLKVTFSASLTNATYNAIIKSVQWNFGDGNGSRVLDLMPMHPYERAGTYTVTCYIVTEDDMTATKNFQITVGDPAVVDDLENQYAERVNQAVLISGLACAAGLVLIACYIKVAGRRGWINRLVPVMILVAMLAISATLIGSAMQ